MSSVLNQENIEKHMQIAKSLPGKERDKFTVELNRISEMKTELLKDSRFTNRSVFENKFLPNIDSYNNENIDEMYNWIKNEEPEDLRKYINDVLFLYKQISLARNDQLKIQIYEEMLSRWIKNEEPEDLRKYINDVLFLYKQISLARNNDQLKIQFYEEMLSRTRTKIDDTKSLINEILDKIEINEYKYSKQMSDPRQMSKNFQNKANAVIKYYKKKADSNLIDLMVVNETYDALSKKDAYNNIDRLFNIVVDLNERMTNMNMFFKNGNEEVETINIMASIVQSYPDNLFKADKRRNWRKIFTDMLDAFKAGDEYENTFDII
jgi:hypothetical protein